MTASRTDIHYGRRGGGWADEFDAPEVTGPPCSICARPMVVGQRGVHMECCRAQGGRTPVCNPIQRRKRDGGGKVCAGCWRDA